MTKKQWEKLGEVDRLKYCIHLGWKCCQGKVASKAANKEIQQIMVICGEAK